MRQIKSKYMVAVVSNQIKAKLSDCLKTWGNGYKLTEHKRTTGSRILSITNSDPNSSYITWIVIYRIMEIVGSFRERYSDVYLGINIDENGKGCIEVMTCKTATVK